MSGGTYPRNLITYNAKNTIIALMTKLVNVELNPFNIYAGMVKGNRLTPL